MARGFKWFPPTRDDLGRAVQRALLGAGEQVLEESNRTVPLLEGPLQSSGTVEADEDHVVISYDTPYAVVQHEDMSLHHAPGRRAKFLQLAVQENAMKLHQWIAQEIAGVFR